MKSAASPRCNAFLLAAFGCSLAGPAYAGQEPSIQCPPNRTYRDVRSPSWREEFCELSLPGSLIIKDGPYRSWSTVNRVGEEGRLQMGRRVGRWRDCDRFERCRSETSEPSSDLERAPGVKQEIPLTYSGSKYVFDFSSCWSTAVTHRTSDTELTVGILRWMIRCQVVIGSSEDTGRSGRVGYLCEIPFSVGVKAFDSLDLRSELPKAGLPQFCRKDDPPVNTPTPDRYRAMAWAVWVYQSFIDGRTRKPARAWTPVANMVDVECAAIESQKTGPNVMTLRLNQYAEELVLSRLGKDQMKADTCGGSVPLVSLGTRKDTAGRSLFVYRLSQSSAAAERQRLCMSAEMPLRRSCDSLEADHK